MTIPFADFFNKAKARLKPAAAHETPAPSPSTPTEKASNERLSKTVLPNTIRTLARPDASRAATAPATMAKQLTPAPTVRPAGAGSARPGPRSRQSLRPSALGLEPKVERTISLQLADIIEQMPAGYVKSQESLDLSRPVQLKAVEVEKGMGESNPSVPLTSLYEQAPEIFLHRLSPAESACVPLSFGKVLEQLNSLRVRSDQVNDDLVPQVDTPFLKLTLEDTERFGTTMEPLQSSALPPVRVEPAIAETIAAATPEPVASQTIKRRSLPLLHPSVSLHEPISKKQDAPPAQASAPAAPKRISLHLPPNGTGVPASERVPASSGPPVPTSLPEELPQAAPIPFTKITAPSEDLREKFQRSSVAGPAREVAVPPSPPKRDDDKIALSLSRLLEEVPAFQLNGSPLTVPEHVRVELPVSLIQPQLASGRVVISPKVFQRAMPEIYRDLVNVDPGETPISLPLQEILKNLPANVLRLREDQEETVLTEKYETMFSIKADEDAKRLRAGVEPVGKLVEKPAEQPQIQETVERKREEQPEITSAVARASAIPSVKEAEVAEPLGPAISIKADEEANRSQARTEAAPKVSTGAVAQPQIQTKIELEREDLSASASRDEEKLDAKSVLARARALPGVQACVIAFADDGLSLAGSLPVELAADGLCAVAPSLLQKIANHMRDTKLGLFTSMTLNCERSPLTFFRHGNICLTVLHSGGGLTPETRAALATMTWALSRTYSKPEPSHVDH